MKKLFKVLAILLALYLGASAAMTMAYNIAPLPTPGSACSIPWEIATHRNGLLIFDADESGLYLLNPANNYGDDWIVLIER